MALMDIKVNDQVIGTLDPAELTIGDELDLEDCRSLRDMMDWLCDHAEADEDTLEGVLRPLKLPEILNIRNGIAQAIGAALPNESDERSSRRSRRTDRARRAG